MKSNIRKNTFETNSSSVHTLILPKGTCAETLDIIDGVLTVECGDFSDSGIVYGLHEKLSYLCSYIALENTTRWDIEEGFGACLSSDRTYSLSDLCEAVKTKYPELQTIMAIHCEDAEFDHQTHPCSSSCIVNLWNMDEVATFLFNDEIKIEMGRD